MTKVGEGILPGFSISTISSFKSMKSKHDVCRGKDWLKKFCEFLRKLTIKTINFKKEEMNLLANERQKSYENAKI